MNYTDKMKLINGCKPALDWSEGKTFEECYNTSEWGEYMGFVFDKLNSNDLRKYKVAGLCALLAKDYMTTDQIKICNDVINYSKGLTDLRTIRLNIKNTQSSVIKERDNRDDLSKEQCALNAIYYANRGIINATCYWVAGTGDEVILQSQMANLIRQELPKEIWRI